MTTPVAIDTSVAILRGARLDDARLKFATRDRRAATTHSALGPACTLPPA